MKTTDNRTRRCPRGGEGWNGMGMEKGNTICDVH